MVAIKDKNSILVGANAESSEIRQYKNFLFDAKRLIGRKFDDPHIQELRTKWPFDIVADEDNNPKYRIALRDQKGKPIIPFQFEEYLPEQISQLVLDKIRRGA